MQAGVSGEAPAPALARCAPAPINGLERCYAALEAAAAIGARCPSNGTPIRTAYVEQLAHDGRIRCTVYGKGWRVVEIVSGPYAGARTAAPPHQAKPWRTYSEDGCFTDRWRARERARKPPRPAPSLAPIHLPPLEEDDVMPADQSAGPGHNSGEAEQANTAFARDQLRSIIERIERLEEEKKTTSDDIRDVYTEAKSNGFDVKALRTIIRLRKMDTDQRREEEAVLETYMHALGMLT